MTAPSTKRESALRADLALLLSRGFLRLVQKRKNCGVSDAGESQIRLDLPRKPRPDVGANGRAR